MSEFAGQHEEILKILSAAAMSDAYTLRSSCFELNKHLHLKPARMAEEATTLNFVRRLVTASQLNPTFNAGAMLHSRQLESAHSKADLELVVKLPGNTWLNLVLQAKSLQKLKNRWCYPYWDASKNSDLINWCNAQSRMRGCRLVPGMLLYNEDANPFRNTRHTNPFGACDLTRKYVSPSKYSPIYWSGWNAHLASGRTPAGISMCLDQHLMSTLDKPMPSQLTSSHFPLEHLAHINADGDSAESGGRSEWELPIREFLSEEAPGWAYDLLERGQPRLETLEREEDEEVISIGYAVIDLS